MTTTVRPAATALDRPAFKVADLGLAEWGRKEIRLAEQEMPGDPDMKMPEEMPFNGKRMIFGGFTPIVTWGR